MCSAHFVVYSTGFFDSRKNGKRKNMYRILCVYLEKGVCLPCACLKVLCIKGMRGHYFFQGLLQIVGAGIGVTFGRTQCPDVVL